MRCRASADGGLDWMNIPWAFCGTYRRHCLRATYHAELDEDQRRIHMISCNFAMWLSFSRRAVAITWHTDTCCFWSDTRARQDRFHYHGTTWSARTPGRSHAIHTGLFCIRYLQKDIYTSLEMGINLSKTYTQSRIGLVYDPVAVSSRGGESTWQLSEFTTMGHPRRWSGWVYGFCTTSQAAAVVVAAAGGASTSIESRPNLALTNSSSFFLPCSAASDSLELVAAVSLASLLKRWK